jgi:hypothetical protein
MLTLDPIPAVADAPPPRPRRLSNEIDALLAALSERPVTLREIIAVIHGRAYMLLLILLSLPFCSPVPVPGLSTVLGAIIALIGLRLSLRAKPWLPAALLDAPVASAKVATLLRGSRKVARGMEVFLCPRWCILVDLEVLHHFYGAMICISGLLLLLPLPIPFSNLIPALSIIFLAAAMVERDGYFIVAGVIMFGLTLAFFGGIFWGGAAVVNWLQDWFGGIFQPDETPPPDFPLPLPTPTDAVPDPALGPALD